MNQISDDIKKDYKNLAEGYEDRWGDFVFPARKWLLSRLQSPKDKPLRVLDLGCGTGGCLYLIGQNWLEAELTGFDLSADMLSVAKDKLSSATLQEANLETIELEKSHYDVVVNFFVLHHIVDQSRFLKNLIKTSKSGGDIFIADYAIDSLPMFFCEIFWRLFLPSHYKAYSSARFRKMLEAHKDIEIIASESFSPNWFWRQQAYHIRRL